MLQFRFRGDIDEGKCGGVAELGFNEILRAALVAVCTPTDDVRSVGEGLGDYSGGDEGNNRRQNGIAHIETELLLDAVGYVGIGGDGFAAKTGLDIGVFARGFEGGGCGYGGCAGGIGGGNFGVEIGFESGEGCDVGGSQAERYEIDVGDGDEVAKPYSEIGVVGGIEVCHWEIILFEWSRRRDGGRVSLENETYSIENIVFSIEYVAISIEKVASF